MPEFRKIFNREGGGKIWCAWLEILRSEEVYDTFSPEDVNDVTLEMQRPCTAVRVNRFWTCQPRGQELPPDVDRVKNLLTQGQILLLFSSNERSGILSNTYQEVKFLVDVDQDTEDSVIEIAGPPKTAGLFQVTERYKSDASAKWIVRTYSLLPPALVFDMSVAWSALHVALAFLSMVHSVCVISPLVLEVNIGLCLLSLGLFFLSLLVRKFVKVELDEHQTELTLDRKICLRIAGLRIPIAKSLTDKRITYVPSAISNLLRKKDRC